MTTTEHSGAARLHTIGEVCRRLQEEFTDISISKIRYLEDQGLLTPKRTRGGYRLFTDADVERLETILRMQRDEFLPLRVIREELEMPGADRARRAKGLREREDEIDLDELCERAGVQRTSRASSRSTGCSRLASRGASVSTARAMPTSPLRPRGSPATGSTHATSAPSERRPAASRRCSSSSSPRRCAHGILSAARRRSTISTCSRPSRASFISSCSCAI